MAKKEKLSLPVDQGCVLYVDGGCRPGYPDDNDSRYGGWGFHGYTYNLGTHPPKLRTKKDIPTVKGYLIGDTVKLEEQVVPTGYIDAFGSMGKKEDSARAELKGFHEAIKFAKEKDFKKLHILMDNQYVIDGVTGGYDKWDALNWKRPDGGTYAHGDRWKEIMFTYKPYNEDDRVSIEWVNGHSGNLGNDRADYLATKGVYFGRNGNLDYTKITESPIAKYRDPKPNLNRLFVKNRWYFNTDEAPLMSKDGRYVYHCGAHGNDDTLVGKAIADSVAYIVYTKEIQKVLEDVRQRHRQLIPNPYNELCMGRLDTLLLPRIYDEIEKDGVNVLSLAPRRLRFEGLCTIDDQMVTKVIRPSGLTFKLIDTHNFMQMALDSYLEGNATSTDVTKEIYKEVPGKKNTTLYELIMSSGTNSLTFQVNVPHDEEMKACKLTIGIDCPPRELLNAIKDLKPKVNIMTWRLSSAAFRYAMIIETEDDVMMWMGKDSNLQLVYPKAWLE